MAFNKTDDCPKKIKSWLEQRMKENLKMVRLKKDENYFSFLEALEKESKKNKNTKDYIEMIDLMKEAEKLQEKNDIEYDSDLLLLNYIKEIETQKKKAEVVVETVIDEDSD